MSTKKKISSFDIVRCVTCNYVMTGKSMDAKEISTSLGVSISQVRSLLSLEHGCPDGLDSYKEPRPSFSNMVRVYEPSKLTLRRQLCSTSETLEVADSMSGMSVSGMSGRSYPLALKDMS